MGEQKKLLVSEQRKRVLLKFIHNANKNNTLKVEEGVE